MQDKPAGLRPPAPISDAAIKNDFPVWIENQYSRLKGGRDNYGDESFRKDPISSILEVMGELEDVSGWSFLLWCRCRRLIENMEAASDKDNSDFGRDLARL
jgi:hypothetical protein